MSKLSQKQIIQKYLQAKGEWVLAGLVRSIATDYGFIGLRGDRDLREMTETPELCKKWGLEKGMRDGMRIVRAIPYPSVFLPASVWSPRVLEKVEREKELSTNGLF